MLSELSHIYVHSKTVLCVDGMSDMIVSGGADRIIKIVKLGPCGLSRTVHTLQGHRQRVLCIKIGQGLVISGSADRTARIWSTKTGNCLRVLVHELEVCNLFSLRVFKIVVKVWSLDFDSFRLLTGDNGGYVFVWDLEICLDESAGPEKLCMRGHNAVPILMNDDEKTVFSVYLEPGAMIHVGGSSGRIVLSDFWNHDGEDEFQLESYVHDKRAVS